MDSSSGNERYWNDSYSNLYIKVPFYSFAEFTFDGNFARATILTSIAGQSPQSTYQQMTNKYGEPNFSKGNLRSAYEFKWQQSDGIEISMSSPGPEYGHSVYFTHLANYKQMETEKKNQKQIMQEKRSKHVINLY
jgi:hypothetical protein